MISPYSVGVCPRLRQGATLTGLNWFGAFVPQFHRGLFKGNAYGVRKMSEQRLLLVKTYLRKVRNLSYYKSRFTKDSTLQKEGKISNSTVLPTFLLTVRNMGL
jgi:hypothetical protein